VVAAANVDRTDVLNSDFVNDNNDSDAAATAVAADRYGVVVVLKSYDSYGDDCRSCIVVSEAAVVRDCYKN
jgi:hypothetical protein